MISSSNRVASSQEFEAVVLQPGIRDAVVGLVYKYGYYAVMHKLTAEIIRSTLRRFGGNKRITADRLQIQRTTLIEKCRRLVPEAVNEPARKKG